MIPNPSDFVIDTVSTKDGSVKIGFILLSVLYIVYVAFDFVLFYHNVKLNIHELHNPQQTMVIRFTFFV